jgi:hypothetical protein
VIDEKFIDARSFSSEQYIITERSFIFISVASVGKGAVRACYEFIIHYMPPSIRASIYAVQLFHGNSGQKGSLREGASTFSI